MKIHLFFFFLLVLYPSLTLFLAIEAFYDGDS